VSVNTVSQVFRRSVENSSVELSARRIRKMNPVLAIKTLYEAHRFHHGGARAVVHHLNGINSRH
jgi:hypothetical protein